MDIIKLFQITAVLALTCLTVVHSSKHCSIEDPSPCNNHGSCGINGKCVCNAYYAGPQCEECVLCGGDFSHVWSCVECRFKSAASDKHYCLDLHKSGQCNNVAIMLVFEDLEQYNLVHEIGAAGSCMLKYGVDIKENAHRAKVHVLLDCNA